jgi:uncharacterized coiled-coil protein SlyX
MILNCNTHELQKVAQVICGDKMNFMEQRIAELTALSKRQEEIICELEKAVIAKDEIIKKIKNNLLTLLGKLGML